MEEHLNVKRSSKEIQERMYKNRLEKMKLRNGYTEHELINIANNPKFYRR